MCQPTERDNPTPEYTDPADDPYGLHRAYGGTKFFEHTHTPDTWGIDTALDILGIDHEKH